MEHAYFSPSASPRWIPCPASLFLTESTQQETSEYAHEGIVCHDIAAQCLTKNIAVSDFAGKIIEGVSMTPELIDAMQMYIDEIRGLAKEYSASGGKIEHKVTLTEHCWGTTDALLWNKDTAIICDLKMGKGVIVSAENNSQMKLYSVLNPVELLILSSNHVPSTQFGNTKYPEMNWRYGMSMRQFQFLKKLNQVIILDNIVTLVRYNADGVLCLLRAQHRLTR